MSLPTEAECLKFMNDSKNAIHDPDHGTWFIGGVEFPQPQAIKLAEYCLLIGSPLTSIATVEGALNIARRVKTLEDQRRELEDRIDRLKDDVDRAMASRHWHWWRRSRG